MGPPAPARLRRTAVPRSSRSRWGILSGPVWQSWFHCPPRGQDSSRGRCYTGQSRRPGAVAAGGPGGGDRLGQRAEGGPKAMSQLVVITFDDEEQAGRALQSIRQVERQGQLK